MRIYKEIELRDFEAWSGASNTMETLRKLDDVVGGDVFSVLEDCLVNDGIDYDETELNDFLWFETDTIAEWLGYNSWEALKRMANEDEEEIGLEYAKGDVVELVKCITAKIVEVDENDKELPYFVIFKNENGEIVREWEAADEIDHKIN